MGKPPIIGLFWDEWNPGDELNILRSALEHLGYGVSVRAEASPGFWEIDWRDSVEDADHYALYFTDWLRDLYAVVFDLRRPNDLMASRIHVTDAARGSEEELATIAFAPSPIQNPFVVATIDHVGVTLEGVIEYIRQFIAETTIGGPSANLEH